MFLSTRHKNNLRQLCLNVNLFRNLRHLNQLKGSAIFQKICEDLNNEMEMGEKLLLKGTRI